MNKHGGYVPLLLGDIMTNYYIASYTIDKTTDKNLETIIEKYYKKHGVLMSKSSCVRLLINSSVNKYD